MRASALPWAVAYGSLTATPNGPPCPVAMTCGLLPIGAGMLIVAGDGRGLPVDYDELERWTRVSYEPGDEVTQGRAVKVAAS